MMPKDPLPPVKAERYGPRATRLDEDFAGDKRRAAYTPHRHAALAIRLYEESKRHQAALSAFYRPRKVVRKPAAKRSKKGVSPPV